MGVGGEEAGGEVGHRGAEGENSRKGGAGGVGRERGKTEPTGLPSKRGPGLGSFSRADRGIGGQLLN